jgi:hypothetical protein
MNILINLIAAGCAFAASAQAQIGQTLAECVQRYGATLTVPSGGHSETGTRESNPTQFKILSASSPTSVPSDLSKQIVASNSDLSDLTDEELTEAAQIDAQSYYTSHSRITKDSVDTDAIGTAHAMHHHLLGDQAFTYEVSFFETLDALIADKD